MTLQEVARRLDVPEKTIYGRRYRGKGPKGHRVGKYVRYWWSDVVEWLEQRADRNLKY
ncbi:MAG TPA: helix-turn-helix domain-containing protein [Actinomycetota bacterium]|nr:helix-turn-helix domain-containing protein [Actinomycetota bacterium]